MFFKRILIIPFCLFQLTLFGQIKIGNNPTSINSNSVLELEATNKGLLLPRVALSATNNFSPLSAFVAGMTIYNTATAGSSPNNVVPGFYYCDGTKWVKIGDEVGASKWTNVPASSRVQLTNLSDGTTARTSTAQFVITDLGRVGIGASVPIAKLDVISNPTFDYSYGIRVNGTGGYSGTTHKTFAVTTNDIDRAVFYGDGRVLLGHNGGNIGIGDSSPREKLHVTGNIRFSGALMPDSLPGSTGQVLTSAGAGNPPTWTDVSSLSANNIYNTNGTLTGNRTVTQGASTLAFTSSATNGFSVDGTTLSVDAANNRIGLGTSSPNYQLSLGSSTANTKLAIWDGASGTSFGLGVQANQFRFNINQAADKFSFLTGEAGTEILSLLGTGNLGVGVVTPSEKLQVAGNVRFSGALMPNNMAGTAGQILTSAGAGTAPTWTDASEVDGIIGNEVTDATVSGGLSRSGTGTTVSPYTLGVANGGITNTMLATDAVTTAKIANGTILGADLNQMSATTGQILFWDGTVWKPGNLAFPSSNIYNTDGTLDGNRIVTQGTNTLTFTSSVTNAFSVDGTTFSVDASLNRIGVGTTSPAATLDVRGYGIFTNGVSGIGIGQAGYADLYAFGTNRLTMNYNRDMPTDINFLSDSSVTVVVGGTGKFGVGKQYPSEKLDVYGNLRLSGAFMPNNLAGTTGQVLTSTGTGTAPTWTDVSSLGTNNIYNTNGTLTGNRTVTQGANTLAFTSTATNGFSVDGTTFSVDASNDRVGFGTSTPNYRLSLGSSIANTKLAIWDGGSGTSFGIGVQASQFRFNVNSTGDRFSFLNGEVGTEIMSLTGTGNLGIGISTPSEKLQVSGNVRFSGALMPNNLAGTSGQVLTSAGAGTAPTWTDVTSLAANNIYNANGTLSGNRTVTQGASTLAFTSSATNGFSVDGTTFSVDAANNRIGIGTATPARALDVFGASMAVTNSGDRGVTIAHSYTNTASTASTLQLAKSRGTFASPTDIQSGDDMGRIEFRTIAYRAQGGALIIGQASENQTSTANGSHLYFQTTPNGSTTETTRMLISQNGNVGIGTISPVSKLDVRGYGYFGTSSSGTYIGQAGYSDIHAIGTGNRLTFNYGVDLGTDINFNSDANVSIVTGGTGQLGVGTLSPDAKLTVSGTASKTGGGAWATFSDQRVKTDIKQFTDGLEVLMRLNPVSFKYNEKSGYNDLNKTYIGFIAQEVEKVTPYMVTTFDDSKGPSGLSDKRQFDESALTKIMVNAIQEQQALIEKLTKQVELLNQKIEQIEKK